MNWLVENQPQFFKQLNFDRDQAERPISDLDRKLVRTTIEQIESIETGSMNVLSEK